MRLSLTFVMAAALAGCVASAADSTTPQQSVEITPPDWAHLQNIYTGSRVSIGNYPVDAEFGRNGTGIVQGIVGAVQIPSNMIAQNHSAGVAGYARTASTTNMAVGLHGFGGITADGGQAEGGHFLSTNCGAQWCPPGTGVNASNNYIIEADINLMNTPNGPPQGNAFGLILFGASETAPAGSFQAIRIDSPGVFHSPVIPWKEGLFVADGAASVGINLGATTLNPTSESQPILLQSRAPGANTISVIQAGSNGDLTLSAGSGTTVVNGWGLRISKAQSPTSSTMPCVTGQIQWDASYTYVCIEPNHWRRSGLSDF